MLKIKKSLIRISNIWWVQKDCSVYNYNSSYKVHSYQPVEINNHETWPWANVDIKLYIMWNVA